MIFVTIGTSEPFDRLLASLDCVGADEELIVQCGRSTIAPEHALMKDFMTFDDVVDHVRRARVVVAHAGAGTILTCLGEGKIPIVVPRLATHGEAVDDHQVEFARRLDGAGLVRCVEDLAHLRAAIAKVETLKCRTVGAGPLAASLHDYLAAELAGSVL